MTAAASAVGISPEQTQKMLAEAEAAAKAKAQGEIDGAKQQLSDGISATEELYETCMLEMEFAAEKLAGYTDGLSVESMTKSRLMSDTGIDPVTMGKLAMELRSFGVKDLKDVQPSDWENMATYQQLSDHQKIALKAAVERMTGDKVKGLTEVLEKARIRGAYRNDIYTEIVRLGVVDITELEEADWEALDSWNILISFEQRRLREVIAKKESSSDQPEFQSVEGLAELFEQVTIRSPEKVEAFRHELQSGGHSSVNAFGYKEEDWTALTAWAQLTKFEQKRLKAEIAERLANPGGSWR
jgi:hypothetical protein